MRNIKFRAKRTDTKNWVYGHYLTAPLTVENFGTGFITTRDQKRINCIADFNGVLFEIDRETLGHFTGLLDKNGKEIFEGDIIKETHDQLRGYIYSKAHKVSNYSYISQVIWCNMYHCFMVNRTIDNKKEEDRMFPLNNYNVERIGNIFDNPELLISDKTLNTIESSVKNIKNSKPIDNRWLSETEI